MNTRRLGYLLVDEGLISEEQLEQAMEECKNGSLSLIQGLVGLKIIDETQLAHFLAHQFGIETADLAGIESNGQARIIPPAIARQFRLIPVSFNGKQLTVAVDNPGDVDVEEVKRASRLPDDGKVTLAVAPLSQIDEALAKLYPPVAEAQNGNGSGTGDIAELAAPTGGDVTVHQQHDSTETMDPDDLIAQMEETVEVDGDGQQGEEYSVESANDAPVIRLCNHYILDAVRRRVSDIHLNPTARGLVVRFRVDGTLQRMPSPPRALANSIVARYKVMAKMNITERRKPQDGRIKIKVVDKTIDLRVSVIPQMDGENVVMRILDQSSLQLDLTKLGLEQQELATYNEAISAPYGLVLHTGPTGSGKTTTLYSALHTIFDPKKNFITLEDPVEYEMPGIVQVQMERAFGLDFATALRSALRQDPNVMMVGEIRDFETAKNAIQAALTGHLLFSTLHTNDAPSTPPRLIDLGIEPGYVGTAIRLIVAQRLMKRVCENCKAPYVPTPDDLLKADLPPEIAEGGNFVKGAGCEKCDSTGYKGRLGIYEMMVNSPAIQRLIYERADTQSIREAAEGEGMRSLRNLAIEKWRSGITTVEEVQRVTMGGH